jgi:hypothetical protein
MATVCNIGHMIGKRKTFGIFTVINYTQRILPKYMYCCFIIPFNFVTHIEAIEVR